MTRTPEMTDNIPPELYAIVSKLISSTGEILQDQLGSDIDTNTELMFLSFTLGSILGIAVRETLHEHSLEQINGFIRAGIAATRAHCIEKNTLN